MSASSLCRELLVVAHLFTVHASPGFNDHTYGAGVECRRDVVSMAVGAYRNSFDRPTVYAVAGVQLLEVRRVSLGLVAGVASGYAPELNWPVIAGARAVVDLGRFEIGAIAAPKAASTSAAFVHFTIAWRIGE